MDLSGLRIAVVGGGIGGMAAAAAFAQRGASVTVHEQADALAEVGAGLQVSANGQRVLRALGAVDQTPPAQATISDGTIFRHGRTGAAVARVAPPASGKTWYLHRADLLSLLVSAAERAGVALSLGRTMTPGTLQADLIVAADGAKSVWRSVVDAPVAPSFTGQVAWRAMVPVEVSDATSSLSMAPRAHVVSYPLRRGSLMNIAAIEERTGWTGEGWSLTGDPEEFRARFSGFGGALGEAISQVQTVHVWALHARPVAQNWVRDNVVLLGDAAHPALPFMAQGACLALEDAWVLADALSASPDLSKGLALYQSLRATRARRIVALARGNGWRFHMGWPFNWGAYATLAMGAGLLARKLEWVYAYDARQAVAASRNRA